MALTTVVSNIMLQFSVTLRYTGLYSIKKNKMKAKSPAFFLFTLKREELKVLKT